MHAAGGGSSMLVHCIRQQELHAVTCMACQSIQAPTPPGNSIITGVREIVICTPLHSSLMMPSQANSSSIPTAIRARELHLHSQLHILTKNTHFACVFLPTSCRPHVGPLLEELHCLSVKSLTAGSVLRQVKQHKARGSFPTHLLGIRACKFHVVKEFSNSCTYNDL